MALIWLVKLPFQASSYVPPTSSTGIAEQAPVQRPRNIQRVVPIVVAAAAAAGLAMGGIIASDSKSGPSALPGFAASAPGSHKRGTAHPSPEKRAPSIDHVTAAREALHAGDLQACETHLNLIPAGSSEVAAVADLRLELVKRLLLSFNSGSAPVFATTKCAAASAISGALHAKKDKLKGQWVDWPWFHLDPVESRKTTAVYFRCSRDDRDIRMKAALDRTQFQLLVSRVGENGRMSGRVTEDALGYLVLNPVVIVFSDGAVVSAPDLKGRF
jgi:hypothetical protein